MYKINATELPRIIPCNGSRLMTPSPRHENVDLNSTREQGIAAHYMANAVFTQQNVDPSELVDRRAPNGVYMSADMAEHVDNYLSIVRNHADICLFRSMEYPTRLVIGDTEINGRADYISFSPFGTLNVLDFKYGFTIIEPFENWTLLHHAIAFCIEQNIQPERIVIGVFQPRQHHRLGKLREWTLTYNELCVYYARLIEIITNLSNVLNTGPQCTNCHAIGTCPAARRANMNTMDVADLAFDDDLPNAELSFELDQILRAEAIHKARKSALVELARYRIKHGQIIDNFTLDVTLSNTEWNEGVTPEFVQMITGIDCSKPGLISPTQAIKKGVPEAVVKLYSDRRQTGVKLVRETADEKAKRLFKK